MMLFTLFDSKGKYYLQPFFSRSEATAIREMKNAVNGSNSLLATNPEDYALFHIGSYDEQTGKVTPASNPVHVVNLELLKSQEVEG